ncbi:hypothetical protein LSTR_LSTR013367 [Laodelphax striatellus]|uniref:von Hippel-Lindau disease tumour suppressor beta domain-containing protein n=1 Tax=Laodelphax striatellus TaxID=195883 RepID=A0A482WV61_LAOST|nr:hypothetical protein LSTR_LSTR013367 [Laodelphax striatellus]
MINAGARHIPSSPLSTETANVRIYNATRQEVDVLWVNFTGHLQLYATLSEGTSVDINTFVNHVWVFRDTNTETRFLANGELLFRVRSVRHPCPAFRQLVRITYPILTLREVACIATRSFLPMLLVNRPRLQVSYNSSEEVTIIFRNMTQSEVSLIWLEPDGRQVLYHLIGKKHQTLFSRTMHGHVWLAESTDSGARLLIDGKQAYVAKAGLSALEHTPLVEIRRPLYTLAELAGMRLRRSVYLSRTPVKLDLPVTLLRDLDRGRASYQIH